jgi:hypothetical protein
LDRWVSRPRFVFSIDSLQALHLAMQFASATLEESRDQLEWLGQKDDLGLPRFLQNLPKPQQDRLERIIEREVGRVYTVAQLRDAGKSKKTVRRRTSR